MNDLLLNPNCSQPIKGPLMGGIDDFVCGISLTSGHLIIELFPDCLKVMLFESCFTPQGRY